MKRIEETHPSLIKAVSRYRDENFINVYKEEIQETTVDKAVLRKIIMKYIDEENNSSDTNGPMINLLEELKLEE